MGMTETPSRRRAPGMSAEDRREMIVAAALPLLVEHGSAVTTLQIAKAAGIGEATVFRAFADKDELLDACVSAALRNDHVLAELDAVPLDQPLAARLTEAAATLHAYLDRMGAVIGALHASGRRDERRRPADSSVTGGRAAAAERTHQAVMRLLEPDRATLRLPVEQLAAIFLGILMGRRGGHGGTETSVETLVDVFLHGVVDPASAAT
ncbi:TetR/AcrR family transcriptional regulator [Micromonospora sp. WMMD1120]|uniref:TetR/AcrR family transcriptional regulator n=1 Tax=Micromonospora sp. WMMD1120 TaxID=3016106 RepID=UPI002415E128|nr:TetR/AcrR family transcriptional regulator [Micromonospora sp. WMMD1120]MDG4807587.1 TetR/AcrR family transcriptional regulator [Micromonospora sp. WMMD1120]